MTNFRFLQYQFDLFNSNIAKLKTVKKWQKFLKCKVDVLEISDGKVKASNVLFVQKMQIALKYETV